MIPSNQTLLRKYGTVILFVGIVMLLTIDNPFRTYLINVLSESEVKETPLGKLTVNWGAIKLVIVLSIGGYLLQLIWKEIKGPKEE